MVCLIVILVFYVAGALSQWIAPYEYNTYIFSELNARPSFSFGHGQDAHADLEVGWLDVGHPFGNDRAGRDIFSRVIYGLRTLVILTVAAMVTGGLLLGITLGLISGYFGKMADSVIMRVGEVFLSFPDILLVLLIAATLRPRVTSLVFSIEDATGIQGIVRLGIVDYVVVFGAMAAFSWVGMARLVRGQVLYIKELQYVEAAQATGASTLRILLVHVLPNVLSPVIVVVSMGMGGLVFTAVVLGWLGIGVQPPTPDLGRMLFENGNIGVLRSDPHLLLFPVGVITVLIFAFNLLGDAVGDAFNPRTH